jgi:uncharacterized repeat protein (TIGR01451 family)
MSIIRPRSRRNGRRTGWTTSWLQLEALEGRQLLSTIDVITTADSGAGSLRAAILAADASSDPSNTIDFLIPGTGVQTIVLQTALDPITKPTVIDGTTQAGALPGSTIVIEIDGSALPSGSDGLRISAGGSTIRGLDLHGFIGNAIHIDSKGGDTIAGNFIGVDTAGGTVSANTLDGVLIDGVGNNVIGGTAGADRNVISGNNGFGIDIKGVGATSNIVEGNVIGTDVTTTKALPNLGGGIQVINGPSNTIGGTVTGTKNIISGNSNAGVLISGSTATGNLVEGNFIGTTLSGVVALANSGGGVSITGAPGNTIGGTNLNAGNTISGNALFGVSITVSGASSNLVQGNIIGMTSDSKAALGNQGDGVIIGVSSNTIGGIGLNAGNLISSNTGSGIHLLTGAGGNVIQGNFIGTDKGSTLNFGNGVDGVTVDNSSGNTIGATGTATGFVSGAGNSIAFNKNNGVTISAGNSNSIRQNRTFSNTKLAIDLAPPGPNLNHPPTANVSNGANLLANSPSVSSATSSTGSSTITGSLFSTPSTIFQVDFYSNAVLDPSGLGQGNTYLGTQAVTTNSIGLGTYTFNPANPVPLNDIVTATATDPNGNTSEFSPQALNIAPTADVAISATATPTTVGLNGLLTYTLTVSNNGPSNATGLTVTDTLPTNVNVVMNTASQGSITQSGSVVTAVLGSINVGATATITLLVTPTQVGTISNTATISKVDQTDPNQANNTVTTSVTVVQGADVQVTGKPIPTLGTVGSSLDFQFTVTNNGPAPATNVGFLDTLPTSGATFNSVTTTQGTATQSNGTVTALLGTLASGVSAVVTITVTPTAASPLVTTAGVTATEADILPSNNFASIIAQVNPASTTATDGPLVSSVVRSGIHAQPTKIAVTYDAPLNAASAQRVSNYSLVTKGTNGTFGSAGSKTIDISSAAYNASTRTVTLSPKTRIPLTESVQLTVVGTPPNGVQDTNGVFLDGAHTGSPGSNFVTVITGTTPVTAASVHHHATKKK